MTVALQSNGSATQLVGWLTVEWSHMRNALNVNHSISNSKLRKTNIGKLIELTNLFANENDMQ